ncbi:hypothetical protein CU254_26010 [Amycolatopsis sp. AA4]|nr:hypothetical protein CU254_26010 [Amycolatopsis sp. AA4]
MASQVAVQFVEYSFPAEEAVCVGKLEWAQADIRCTFRRCLKVGSRVLGGQFRSKGMPILLPVADISAASPDIGKRYRERGKLAPARSVRQRASSIVRAARQLPVRRTAGLPPQIT